jgi:hypothetical protein
VPVTITFDAFNQILASGTVVRNTLLATTILDFTAIKDGNKAKLSWNINDAYDYNWFEVERSADGNSFEKIGTVKSTDNPNTYNFLFTDNNILTGKSYYRLKILQKDGSFTYSKIVTLSNQPANSIYSISPNPAVDYFIIHGTGNSKKVDIEIYDAGGRKVKELPHQAFSNNSIKIGVHDLVPGSYFVIIRSATEGKFTQQIVIGK